MQQNSTLSNFGLIKILPLATEAKLKIGVAYK